MLLAMAGFAFWKIGPKAAAALAVEAVVVGGLLLAAFR